jgi:hypothetical protein
MDEVTKQRLKRNEAVFRTVNEEIDDRGGDRASVEYVCECSDPSCSAPVALTHEEYDAVRAVPNGYFVVPGHELPEIERVVARHDGHLVVQKS